MSVMECMQGSQIVVLKVGKMAFAFYFFLFSFFHPVSVLRTRRRRKRCLFSLFLKFLCFPLNAEDGGYHEDWSILGTVYQQQSVCREQLRKAVTVNGTTKGSTSGVFPPFLLLKYRKCPLSKKTTLSIRILDGEDDVSKELALLSSCCRCGG